ncbi:hypothetical protein [Alicyclobacillus sp. ALC3]|uniref:hypothetical protein n=1 Tax=Alicyclobacillus sp. ALC3 TaxID=2796143 RepID=UPI002379CA95|nr:hypothetical protein [Alicyclobacillus sp. ALC3]WDL97820.1 hypothetical protein JC200_03555 [Alicyclobacillus sp. ALC3]
MDATTVIAQLREHLQVALEHWEMYEEQWVDVEREAFDAASVVLGSSQMLERAGIAVVDKARLGALEWLYRSEKNSKFSQIQHALLALKELEAMTDGQATVSDTAE